MTESERDSSKNSSLSDQNRCYLCKRTEREVREFLVPNLDKITKRYDSEIASLESMLQDKKNILKSHLDSILESTGKINLDFKIHTILTDIDSFKKIIPSLDDIIEMHEEFQFGNDERNNSHYGSDETLSTVREKITDLRKEIEDDKIYEKNYDGEYTKYANIHDIWYSSGGYYGCKNIVTNEYYVQGKKKQICNEEIDEILRKLEQLHKEKEVHLKSIMHHKEAIKDIRHKKLVQEIETKVNYRTFKIEGNGWIDHRRKDTESYKFSYTVPVCVICHRLVWWESGCISSDLLKEFPPILKDDESIVIDS